RRRLQKEIAKQCHGVRHAPIALSPEHVSQARKPTSHTTRREHRRIARDCKLQPVYLQSASSVAIMSQEHARAIRAVARTTSRHLRAFAVAGGSLPALAPFLSRTLRRAN